MKVDKKIPIPRRTERSEVVTPVLDQLEIGDSFVVPHKHADTVKSGCSVIGRYTSLKFVSRKEGAHTRFWRVQ